MLEPTDRTLFPPGCKCLSVGPRQRTCGSSPRSPAGVWVLLQGFSRGISLAAWYVSQPASAMSQPASVTHAQLMFFASGASQEV
jgi:hypothetical protein